MKGPTENEPTIKFSPYNYPEEIKQHVPTGDSLSLFHINISSLGYHFHELEDLLTLCNTVLTFLAKQNPGSTTKRKVLQVPLFKVITQNTV